MAISLPEFVLTTAVSSEDVDAAVDAPKKELEADPREWLHRIVMEPNAKIALFVRSIQKRKVHAMSKSMFEFLETIDRDDPALDEIAKVFPEDVAKHRGGIQPPPGWNLCDLICNGSFTEEDVRTRLSEDLSAQLKEWRLYSALHKMKPQNLYVLLTHPDIRRFVNTSGFLCNVINAGNEELVVFMENNATRLGIDIEEHMRNLIAFIVGPEASNILFKALHFIPITLRHLPYTMAELEVIWTRCLEEANLDAIEAIEKCMQALKRPNASHATQHEGTRPPIHPSR